MPLTRCLRLVSAGPPTWVTVRGIITTYLGARKKLALYIENHVSKEFPSQELRSCQAEGE